MLPSLSNLPRRRTIDDVLRAAPPIATTYQLFGNAKSDWGTMYFDDYDQYLKIWHDFQRLGWLNASDKEPLTRSGGRVPPPPRPPPTYSFMTNRDYVDHSFTDYDEYLRAWETARAGGTLFAPSSRDDRYGHPTVLRSGGWKRVPYTQ
jgi:hypothetical protein